MTRNARAKSWLAVAGALALSACASAGPTPYQPATERNFGFKDQRIEQDRWRVMFEGNSRTSRQQVEDGLLLRAAEVTLAGGFDWFKVVTRATDPKVTRTSVPSPYFDTSFAVWRSWSPRRGWVLHASPWAWHGSRWPYDRDEVETTRYQASAEIIMGRGEKPAGDPQAFGARDVQASLAPRLAPPPSAPQP